MSKETKSNIRLVLGVAAIIGALVLVGCATNDVDYEAEQAEYLSVRMIETSVTLNDGRHVTCVVLSNYKGMSCDWEGASDE